MELTGAFEGTDDYEQLEFGELKLLGELKLRETALRDLHVLKKKLQVHFAAQIYPVNPGAYVWKVGAGPRYKNKTPRAKPCCATSCPSPWAPFWQCEPPCSS